MSAGAIGGTATASASGAFGNIKSEDFIKILTTELANQDPFNPQDSSALLEQLSSLRNIESQLSLQTQIASLVNQNEIAAAGTLIGRMVVGRDTDNSAVEGIVTTVRIENGKPVLELDTGKALPMSRVLQISDAG